jgi:transcription factor Dp
MEQEEHGLTPLPQAQDLSNSTLWSETSRMPKVHKTLKQLSQEVKQYIMEKGHCTYKEVADEIVKKEACYNEKNIRRRVYDAINVLTAVNIFEKRGKQVCIVEKNCNLIRSINKKRDTLRKLAMRYQNLRGIVVRNSELPHYREAIQMPFVIVFTKKNVRFI